MLSLPDFKEKQLLFINGLSAEKDKIRFMNDNVQLIENGKIKNQISCHKIFAIFIIGDCTITSVLIRKCQLYGISLFLMRDNLLTYAKIISLAEGNYLLRTKQYGLKNELQIAKKIVQNKITNQAFLLKKSKIDSNYLVDLIKKAGSAKDAKSLLGTEGIASKFFFENFFKKMDWRRRTPRAKPDSINTLMDLGYIVLFNFIDSLLGIYGFDSYKGFYHKLFFQRKSLACDIMEPFRYIIEKQIIKSFNLKQINKKDFIIKQGRCEISYETQNKYLKCFSEAIMDEKEKIFLYVKEFYYFLINDDKFPILELK
ncbi:MAG: type V CRISPR-associated endonuclease Cas1 [Patescibacteria group bacterium]